MTPTLDELERLLAEAPVEHAYGFIVGGVFHQRVLPVTRECINAVFDALPSLIAAARERDRLTAENERYRKAQAEALEYPANMQRLEELQATNERLRDALRMIAGEQQCIDNLLGNVDIARAALAGEKP